MYRRHVSVCMVVCVSVMPSIVRKWLNLGSHKKCHTNAVLRVSDAKDICEIQMGSPPTEGEATSAGGVR